MFRLIGFIVVALLIVAGIGWYRGWFHVHTYSGDGVRQVDVTVDKEKLHRDEDRLRQELTKPPSPPRGREQFSSICRAG